MTIYHQSTFDRWPLDDGSVQAIITSPPYWALREYDIPDIVIGGDPSCEHKYFGPGACSPVNTSIRCGAWKGQHGLEPDYQLYIEHVRLWALEAWRVLRDDGVFFLNLGDCYGGSWGAYSHGKKGSDHGISGFPGRVPLDAMPRTLPPTAHAPEKCKMLIPHRVAIALIDEGWICRNDIVWEKPNGIPESMKDRFSCRFEYVFMLTKSPEYYFDLDAVRVPYKPDSLRRYRDGYKPQNVPDEALPGRQKPHTRSYKINPHGANPGDVWRISASKCPDIKHYSTYPDTLADRLVRCSSRPGDIVLDPFCGSGTTVKVAEGMHREAIGFDLGYEDVQAMRLAAVQKELM